MGEPEGGAQHREAGVEADLVQADGDANGPVDVAWEATAWRRRATSSAIRAR